MVGKIPKAQRPQKGAYLKRFAILSMVYLQICLILRFSIIEARLDEKTLL
jgi:hypothetical protein